MPFRKFFQISAKVFYGLDIFFNALFSSRLNPLYHSGTIALLALGIASFSGLYLFIFYRIGAEASYDSVEKLAQHPFYIGSLMRGLHRYASDLAILASAIHALRLFSLDRFRGHRWLAWASGICWLFLIWIIGITGYWLVWDQRGQMAALSIARSIDVLLVGGEPFSRSFLYNSLVKDNLFFILLFLHIVLSIFMAGMWWLHHSRISRPRIFPPFILTIAILTGLVITSLSRPATNAPRADLTILPSSVPLDLFYLFFVPMIAFPAWIPLASGGAFIAFFTSLPWLFKPPAIRPVVVLPQACTSCLNCYKDCPYEALSMQPVNSAGAPRYIGGPLHALSMRPLNSYKTAKNAGGQHVEWVHVYEERCASCGLCIGACEFGAITGDSISWPELESKVMEYYNELKGEKAPILVFLCQLWPEVKPFLGQDGNMKGAPGIRVIPVPCMGALPPALFTRALELGFAGIFLASCIADDCRYRHGYRWADLRLRGQRPPFFHEDLRRIRLNEYVPLESKRFTKDLLNFKKELSS